jgi:hypothetical protein
MKAKKERKRQAINFSINWNECRQTRYHHTLSSAASSLFHTFIYTEMKSHVIDVDKLLKSLFHSSIRICSILKSIKRTIFFILLYRGSEGKRVVKREMFNVVDVVLELEDIENSTPTTFDI